MTPGRIVRVVDATNADVYNVSRFIGRIGEVLRIGTKCKDPTFAEQRLVGFCDGTEESFWPEELRTV